MHISKLLRLTAAVVVAIGLSAGGASADIVDITMTGTLSNGSAGFPWGLAYPDTAEQFSVVGATYTANFRFNTAVGTVTTYADGNQTLSGPASIGSGTVTVDGDTFSVPTCVDSPCTTTTTAIYGRSADSIIILFYEDASASSGLVLEASAVTPWGTGLTRDIPMQSVLNIGEDIVLQPANQYYDLVAFATVATVRVTAIPEPASWMVLLAGLMLACSARLVVRRPR